ncbi:hypothetical protein EDD15DRAFT_2197038 [Pisolithus albus]|nr:hypothetical protein EDD15DRAFT_2197038 [Pisolithus albus]
MVSSSATRRSIASSFLLEENTLQMSLPMISSSIARGKEERSVQSTNIISSEEAGKTRIGLPYMDGEKILNPSDVAGGKIGIATRKNGLPPFSFDGHLFDMHCNSSLEHHTSKGPNPPSLHARSFKGAGHPRFTTFKDMFFRIFRFRRKQRQAPSSTSRSAKGSTRPEPLNLPEHPASAAAREQTSVQLSPIIFVSQDPKQVDTCAGRVRVSANSGSGIFSPRPGMPRKKRHVSFRVIKDDAEAGLSSSPPTPYPLLTSFPSSSTRVTRESFSSVSTLVDTDQAPPEYSAVDTLVWEDILDGDVPDAARAHPTRVFTRKGETQGQESSHFDASVSFQAVQSQPILCAGSSLRRADSSDAFNSIWTVHQHARFFASWE